MARRMPVEGRTRGFLQFLKVRPCLGRPREQKAPGRGRALLPGAPGQRLRSRPWWAVPAFGRGWANTPDHGDRMLRFARFAGDHLRCGTGRTLCPPGHRQSIGKWIRLINPAAARIAPAGTPPDDYIERLALASIVEGLAICAPFPGSPSANSKASSAFTEPISGSPGAFCLRSTRLAGASNPLRLGRIAPPSPGRAHRG
jgi:hypothetical protein